jgi:hypothetical protein
MNIKRKRNKARSHSKVLRLPRWSLMILDGTAAQFGITKSDLLRGMLERLESKDELLNAREVLKSSSYLTEPVQFHFHLTEREQFLLEESAKTLKIGQCQVIACLILSLIDSEAERLQQNKPRTRHRASLFHRQVYLAEEMVDALYSVRDERGESISLLLQEAVLTYRERTIKPMPITRKDRNVNLRLTSQQWSKLDTIAASSELTTTDAVAALFYHHFFKGDYYAESNEEERRRAE